MQKIDHENDAPEKSRNWIPVLIPIFCLAAHYLLEYLRS